MLIYDPLYGRFRIPDDLCSLAATPEVRRLSQIRLLNTVTPSMATLGELRRFSHTLGVLYLASQCDLAPYNAEERLALGASVLLHDVGTPPFAHLFEYHLRERANGWSHEEVVQSILWGFHADENRAHQLFAGRTIEFRRLLREAAIDLQNVESIISGRHPLSRLLFGTLDLDNIDNVCRMAWALGIAFDLELPKLLARAISVERESGALVCSRRNAHLITAWQSLRRQVYLALVFDGPTVAAQAVLSAALEILLDAGALAADDWSLTDEELLEKLLNHQATKKSISREYLGALPHVAFVIQLDTAQVAPELISRQAARPAIEDVLRDCFRNQSPLGYVFLDRGSFEKRVEFLDRDDGSSWQCGSDSRSIVLYGFVRTRTELSRKKCRDAASRLIREFANGEGAVMRCIVGRDEAVDAQRSLDFTTPID